MANREKCSSPNIYNIYGRQLQTPEQVQQAPILELMSDPLLWAAYKRGKDDHFSGIYQVTHNSKPANDNDSLSNANYQQNGYIRVNKTNKNTLSQQYRLQKTFIFSHTNCESNEIELMETDN